MRALWLFLLAACGTERETIAIPEPPIDAETRSLIFVFEGETTFIYGIDIDDRSGPLLQIEAPEWKGTDLTATSFAFEYPLAFYELAPGLQAPVEEKRSCGLQRPRSVVQYDRTSAAWLSLQPPYPGLVTIVDETTYGCDPVDLCRNLEAEVVEIDSNSDVHFILAIDEETALIGVDDDRFFTVSRASGVVERADLFGLPSSAGHMSPSGELWLGGIARIAHGTPETGFSDDPVGDPGEEFGAIAVRGEGSSVEAIAVAIGDIEDVETGTVSLYRYFAGAWTQVDRRIEPVADFGSADILWIDERALIVFGGIHGLVWDGANATSFILESPIPLFEPHLNDLAVRADHPIVVASNDGFLYKLQSGLTDWVPIREAVLGNGVKGVAPVFEGFFFGGPDGTINQFYPGSISCNSSRLVMSDADRIIQLGNDILVTGGNPTNRNKNTVTWLSASD